MLRLKFFAQKVVKIDVEKTTADLIGQFFMYPSETANDKNISTLPKQMFHDFISAPSQLIYYI